MGNPKETKKAQMIGSILFTLLGNCTQSIDTNHCTHDHIAICDISDSLRHVTESQLTYCVLLNMATCEYWDAPVNQAQTASPPLLPEHQVMVRVDG